MSKCNKFWGNHFSQQEIEKVRTSGRILSMELELSMACNLRCIYCYAESGAPLENELRFEEITGVVDQAVELGARRIIVLGGGEPLAHPQILPVLQHIHKRGAAIDLFTNGTLLTAEMAEIFAELGVSPVIKMNSMNPEVQDRLAGRPWAFQDISQGFKHLRQAGYPASGLPLGVQTVICRHNLDELPDMWAWIRENSMVPYFETITLQGRARKHPDLLVEPEEIRDLFQRLSLMDKERFGFEWEPHPPVAGLTCMRHLYTCTVTVHGDVIPCPGVNIKVGNIRRDSLAHILHQSSVVQDLRNIRENIKGACRDCELHPHCYGCRGMAYQYTGDYLAADPLCWKNPKRI